MGCSHAVVCWSPNLSCSGQSSQPQPATLLPVHGVLICCLLQGERPSTPEAPPLPDEDGQHAALVLLQRLLRGRAVQNEMYAGKTARLQLVRELRLGLEGTAGGAFCGMQTAAICAAAVACSIAQRLT